MSLEGDDGDELAAADMSFCVEESSFDCTSSASAFEGLFVVVVLQLVSTWLDVPISDLIFVISLKEEA